MVKRSIFFLIFFLRAIQHHNGLSARGRDEEGCILQESEEVCGSEEGNTIGNGLQILLRGQSEHYGGFGERGMKRSDRLLRVRIDSSDMKGVQEGG